MSEKEVEATETTESKITFGDLKKAVIAFVNTVTDTGNFEDSPQLDEKGKPVLGEDKKPLMVTGKPFAELTQFEAFDSLKACADLIIAGQDKGLPLETKLEKEQKAQAEHYAAVKVVDGVPQFDDEWKATADTLSTRIASLKAQIKRRDAEIAKTKAEAEAKAKAEADKAATPEADKTDGANA